MHKNHKMEYFKVKSSILIVAIDIFSGIKTEKKGIIMDATLRSTYSYTRIYSYVYTTEYN